MELEKAVAPHSSTLAWQIPRTEEPGGLQSMGSLRVGNDWATSLSRIGEGNGNPLQCSCLENPRDGGAWWAAVYGVAQSLTGLKRRSSSSSNKAFEKWKVFLEPSEKIWNILSTAVQPFSCFAKNMLPVNWKEKKFPWRFSPTQPSSR